MSDTELKPLETWNDGKYFLTVTERMLLQWFVLDDLGQNLVQRMWDPPTTREDVGALYQEMDSWSDSELVWHFNADVDRWVECAPQVFEFYKVLRPEIRALLSNPPAESLSLEEMRAGGAELFEQRFEQWKRKRDAKAAVEMFLPMTLLRLGDDDKPQKAP